MIKILMDKPNGDYQIKTDELVPKAQMKSVYIAMNKIIKTDNLPLELHVVDHNDLWVKKK